MPLIWVPISQKSTTCLGPDLAVTWETGGATRHPNLRVTLGAEEDWTLATLLSVGIPAESPASFRTPVPNFVYWHE